MLTSLKIIIVNHNLKQDTADCIDSFITSGASTSQIIVVDNASEDGSVDFLRQKYTTKIEIIAESQNLGYAHGINIGIKFALKQGSNWLLLMNNDTIVAPGFLTEFSKAAKNLPDYGLLGPLILYHDFPDKIWFVGGRLVPGTLFTVNLFRGRQENSVVLPDTFQVDFLHGCAMMVRSDVIEKIGLFNETGPMYGDEIDFCWRARLAGFKLAAVPRARMWHKISAFMNKHKPKTRYYRIRNQIRFYRRYGRGAQIPVMFILTTLRAILIGAKDILNRDLILVKPLFQGWRDGWFGHYPGGV